MRFHFLPSELYEDEYNVKPKDIIKHMRKQFFPEFYRQINRVTKIKTMRYDFAVIMLNNYLYIKEKVLFVKLHYLM